MSPIYAEVSSSQPSITLNQLTYLPIHEPKVIENTLYLSNEDFVALTYGELETRDQDEILTIQNIKLTYTSESRTFKVNADTKVLETPVYTIDEITYLPITILDLMDYPYTISKDQLSLSIKSILPYSTSPDSPSSHQLFSTDYQSFTEILGSIISENEIKDLVHTAQSNQSYISLMSTTYKDDCLDLLKEMVHLDNANGLQVNVHFRQLDCTKSSPVVSNLISLPARYEISQHALALTIGKETYKNPFFWATYNPSQNDSISIDLNKSLDIMVMRTLYAYYRDQHDLKDDLQTSPICIVQTGASDQLCYRVYLDNELSNIEYQVVLYKKSTANAIDYYVDFILA